MPTNTDYVKPTSQLLWEISEAYSELSDRPHIGFESVTEMRQIVNPPDDIFQGRGNAKLENVIGWLEWLHLQRQHLEK